MEQETGLFPGKSMKRSKGFFSISAVAKMFSVHQQTIRLYEREGLLSPKRSEGNTRLFSEEDVDRLEQIIYLTHKLGINLAGVQMVLKLQKQIKKMQKDMNRIFDQTSSELQKEETIHKEVIKSSVQQLAKIKTKSTLSSHVKPAEETTEEQTEFNWDIDYEE
jgi:MerR family transcriptional regulator/heat shock protein HspR